MCFDPTEATVEGKEVPDRRPAGDRYLREHLYVPIRAENVKEGPGKPLEPILVDGVRSLERPRLVYDPDVDHIPDPQAGSMIRRPLASSMDTPRTHMRTADLEGPPSQLRRAGHGTRHWGQGSPFGAFGGLLVTSGRLTTGSPWGIYN